MNHQTIERRVIMRKYKITRMAVLIELMSEIIDCGTDEILDIMQEHFVSVRESIEIRAIINEMIER